jgi:hypothetical protein
MHSVVNAGGKLILPFQQAGYVSAREYINVKTLLVFYGPSDNDRAETEFCVLNQRKILFTARFTCQSYASFTIPPSEIG